MVDTFENSFLGSWASDVYKARWAILASAGVGVLITLLYIGMMHCFAGVLAWISVVLVQIGLIFMGFFFYYKRKDIMTGSGSASTTALWWSMFGAWVAAGLMYIFLACNFKSLRVSISVIKTTADWVADTKRLLLMPLCFFAFGVLSFVIWISGLACVASISDQTIVAANPGSGDQAKVLVWSGTTYAMVYIMIFGFIWISCYITSFNEYVTIVAAISWYFSDKTIPDDDGIPGDSQVMLGFKWGFCY